MDPKGGRWSGFSLQQAVSRALMCSSPGRTDREGRTGHPTGGLRSCLTISEDTLVTHNHLLLFHFLSSFLQTCDMT